MNNQIGIIQNIKQFFIYLIAFAIRCYEGEGDDAKAKDCTPSSVYDVCAKIKSKDVSTMFCAVSKQFDTGEEGCELPEKPTCFCKTDFCNQIIEPTTTMTTKVNETTAEEITQEEKSNDIDDNGNRTEVATPKGSSNAAIPHNEVNSDSIQM